MREKDFRRMALGMAGAVEGAHMGHPDFRVNNRIFATLHDDRAFGMVTLTPDQQEQFMRAHPDAFAPESGAWGRGGSTRVTLATVPEESGKYLRVVLLADGETVHNAFFDRGFKP